MKQAFSERPASLLVSIFSQEVKTPELLILTGNKGAGKTAWCLELIDEAFQRRFRVSGLVSPAVMNGRQKVGIDLMDVHNGEGRRLAVLRADGSQKNTKERGLSTMDWIFDPSVIAWGNQILERLDFSELLVLDELGPLELVEGKGLTAGLKCIDDRRYQIACVVIRPALLANAVERWPWGKIQWIVDHSETDASI
jgi:nucleoside-triphosphatase